MTRARRGWAFLLGAGLLVAVLVGGRWLALETAERAWAATIAGGSAYLVARDFARLVSGMFLLLAVAWGTGNLLLVYRTIDSVQLPRRLGDLEIVEAVPPRLLLAATVASGLVYGGLLALSTRGAWLVAASAARAPSFGVADPVLHRDLGYYLTQLPWAERLRAFAQRAAASATVVVALLYLRIGSLRFRRWMPSASAHARAHVGVLLAALALTVTWGAQLDPAETVAGLHGTLTPGALTVRLPAAPFLTALGLVTTLASLIWALRERPRLLAASWGTLLGASLVVYVVLPAVLASGGPRGGSAPPPDSLALAARRLESLAFGVAPADEPAPAFPSPAGAVAAIPVWDPTRVLAAAERQRALLGAHGSPAAAALVPHRPAGEPVTWVVAAKPDTQPSPDWSVRHRGAGARVGPPFVALEGDTSLSFAPLGLGDSATWFGPGFRDFAVASPDTWPRVGGNGLPLVGWWRRWALAWSLQSAALARAETDGLVLLWHRDVRERLERLAPFASFDDATPVIVDGALWWLAYGYLSAQAFPLTRAVAWDGGAARYLRAGLLGTVNGATGATQLYLAPGADSLAAAWARLLAPLIRPAAMLPAGLGAALPYPRRTFRIATRLVAAWDGDSTAWLAQPHDPFELVAPSPAGEREGASATAPGLRVWTAQGFVAADREVTALVAGALSSAGPRLLVWRPRPVARLLPALVGSPSETAPGVLRLWHTGGLVFSVQALFAEAVTGGPPARIDTLFLTWGERQGQGPGRGAALHALVTPGAGARALADTSLAARWEAARGVAARADRALVAGDLEAFARYYAELKEALGVGRRKLAPARRPR
ncbi:MAG TPA: UPF0182 family protein [Gemmatimonadales bacterium]|nr:UPF0182 family protein [Gemmatimonadales bacterium]